MNNKKTLMAFSGILILIFHLWINITSSIFEIYLKQICVIGVDIFFFLSSYSIASKKDINYKEFIYNRFIHIYLIFIIFSIISFIFNKWSIIRLLSTITFIDLFIRGGGSFLWFIPCIMFIYLLLPLYKKIDNKYTFIFISIMYIIISIIMYILNYKELFIFTNRLPIIFIGYYISKYNLIDKLYNNKMIYYISSILLLLIGLLISYICFIRHYNDISYILYIPLIISIILLLSRIKCNKIINNIGSITLELYGIQMIIGFRLANYIYSIIRISYISNIITICIVILISFIVNKIFYNIKKHIPVYYR